MRGLHQISRPLLGIVAALTLAGTVLASVSQGFTTTGPLPYGSLVSLDAKSSTTIIAADLTNSERLFGITVAPSSASIALGNNAGNQTQVSTTGTAMALVSTAGGSIKVGDYIAVSPIAGVGQKAVGKVRVIGTAQSDFDGSGGATTVQTIQTGTGSRQVTIGQIPVMINVASYAAGEEEAATYIPSWLQHLSNAVAGKVVSPVRIIMAGLILLVALFSVTVLLYGAVRNSIISIGRNPLSKNSVLKGLAQVLLIVLVILGASGGAMYVVISK